MKGNLPGQLTFGTGVDIGVTDDFSLALDYLGARVGEADRLIVQPDVGFLNTTKARESFSVNTGSVGFKVNLGRRVLFTMNALIALDSNGLRDHVTPLIGLSFTP
jgi:hypothetical protein